MVGAPIISGLVPCNRIADEILTDHPKRYRAMIIEAANPVHSLADSQRMREAMNALDTVVVIDVAMSESAKIADYVLPAASQFEKGEATFFNFEFPENYFHLRPRLFAPPAVRSPKRRSTRAYGSARCRFPRRLRAAASRPAAGRSSDTPRPS